MLTPQIQKKQFLIWSLISTSARPIPRKVAGTTGLMNVAQLRQTTITIAMCAGTTPKFPAISIRTGINPKKKESVSNIRKLMGSDPNTHLFPLYQVHLLASLTEYQLFS